MIPVGAVGGPHRGIDVLCGGLPHPLEDLAGRGFIGSERWPSVRVGPAAADERLRDHDRISFIVAFRRSPGAGGGSAVLLTHREWSPPPVPVPRESP